MSDFCCLKREEIRERQMEGKEGIETSKWRESSPPPSLCCLYLSFLTFLPVLVFSLSYHSVLFCSLRDKLSAFMESKGAASPGILTLTSNLSKVGAPAPRPPPLRCGSVLLWVWLCILINVGYYLCYTVCMYWSMLLVAYTCQCCLH